MLSTNGQTNVKFCFISSLNFEFVQIIDSFVFLIKKVDRLWICGFGDNSFGQINPKLPKTVPSPRCFRFYEDFPIIDNFFFFVEEETIIGKFMSFVAILVPFMKWNSIIQAFSSFSFRPPFLSQVEVGEKAVAFLCTVSYFLFFVLNYPIIQFLNQKPE